MTTLGARLRQHIIGVEGHLILQSGETDGYCMLAGYGRKVYHIEQYDNRLYLNSIEHETRLLRSEGYII